VIGDEKQSGEQFQRIAEAFVRGMSKSMMLVACVFVLPLTLWFNRVRASTVANQTAVTIYCVAFAWGYVSLLRMLRGLRKLDLSPAYRMRVFSGPRPDDPDELYAWKWAWQFLYAIIAIGLSMIAIPIASWLSGQ
jgi:hypothetical protein